MEQGQSACRDLCRLTLIVFFAASERFDAVDVKRRVLGEAEAAHVLVVRASCRIGSLMAMVVFFSGLPYNLSDDKRSGFEQLQTAADVWIGVAAGGGLSDCPWKGVDIS